MLLLMILGVLSVIVSVDPIEPETTVLLSLITITDIAKGT